MVSRTIPPHHFISAPVTDITPLTIPALADATAARDSASTPNHLRFMGRFLHWLGFPKIRSIAC